MKCKNAEPKKAKRKEEISIKIKNKKNKKQKQKYLPSYSKKSYFSNFHSALVTSLLYIKGHFTNEYSEILRSNFLITRIVDPRFYWESL